MPEATRREPPGGDVERPSRRPLYWACQGGGWTVYALVNAAFGATMRGALLSAASSALLSLIGLALTHALHLHAARHRWWDRPFGPLALRVVGSSVGLAFAALAIDGLVLAAAHVMPLARGGVTTFLVFEFNLSCVFLAWQLLYLGVHLARRAQRAEVRRWKLEAAVQAAELRALKAQMQPHFLFNALNSVRALVAEDPARAQAMITHLAALLRYALGASSSDAVPLDRELDALRDYLALEEMRFEERLRWRIDVSEGARRVAVPVLLLQTLVENAIKHGIAHAPEGGEIAVTARVEAGLLAIEVTNTKAMGLAESIAPAPGGGTGLRNTRERLQLLFGERGGLDLDQSEAAHTTARVRIPVTT